MLIYIPIKFLWTKLFTGRVDLYVSEDGATSVYTNKTATIGISQFTDILLLIKFTNKILVAPEQWGASNLVVVSGKFMKVEDCMDNVDRSIIMIILSSMVYPNGGVI